MLHVSYRENVTAKVEHAQLKPNSYIKPYYTVQYP
jgi:hypothetical protein